MLIASVSNFRKDIKADINKISRNFETLAVNRGKDIGIVIMSLSKYGPLMATCCVVLPKKNEERPDAVIKRLKTKKSFYVKLPEL